MIKLDEYSYLSDEYNDNYIGTYYGFYENGIAYDLSNVSKPFPNIENKSGHPIVIDHALNNVTEKELRETIKRIDPDILLLSECEYDRAILGLANIWRYGKTEKVLVYDLEKVIDIICRWNDSDEPDDEKLDEAYEFWSYNMVCAWMGVKTPIYVARNGIGADA